MVTIYDIAKKANVSAMTVSRVINKSDKISVKTREKVEAIIKELNYLPNSSARSLVSKKTKILSLMITDIANPFFTSVARGAEDKAMQMGYQLMLCNSDENLEKESKYIDMLISAGTDGVLIAPANDSSKKNIQTLTKYNIPFVLLDRHIKDLKCDQVLSDNETTTRRLLEHLIKQGHKRIAIINGPLDVATARERHQAYCDTLTAHGLEINSNLIHQSHFLQDSDISKIIKKMLDLPENERPTAIFATSNFIGVDTVKFLIKYNMKVPEDIAVVCYDGLPNYTESELFITAAEQPSYHFGYMGMQMLIERIENTAPEMPRKIVLPAEIHIRKSSLHEIDKNNEAPR
ncbi:LacI family DNA-binding transcriptional regulator [Lederbergia citrea]|uniref:LacI family DNA-binding transcriptional regulator n=1 Tax=Lederbergia citrea TaxID=2833581 RepID=A0A942URW1_9BACI|nr:LacI family DNA-binding transcriptional regulator [Lederbergia citrea]MBS4206059.1 LacI family DNA-binding transcriptional regulator [Lederbergia citrea]MBS4224492.1 LacI family DNA-binding transcriptional regulator [Lederbergia citrea]